MILEIQCQCKISHLVDMCAQMSHLETSKEDKLSGTLAGWYLNAKSRGTQYKEQLACLETAAAEDDSAQGQAASVQLQFSPAITVVRCCIFTVSCA